MTTAVIFVPSVADYADYAAQCFAYCATRGYEVLGVPAPGDWDAAAQALKTGAATVLVVARSEHLDPNREPRVEVAGQPSKPVAVRRNSRPGMTSGAIPRRLRRPNQL